MELEGRTTLTCPVVDDTAPCSVRPPRSTMIPPPPSCVAEIRGKDLEYAAEVDPMFTEDERETLKRGIVPATTTWRCPRA